MSSLGKVLEAKYIILSVTGPYAGESETDIYVRKMNEIKEVGYTFWHHQSYKAKPPYVQKFCNETRLKIFPPYFVLITTASGRGGIDTKQSEPAKMYRISKDASPKPIPDGIYVETGLRPYAIVIKDLNVVQEDVELDLWEYSDWEGGPVITRQGGSTLCTIKKSSHHSEEKMKSHNRKIVATAEIVKPYAVWLE